MGSDQPGKSSDAISLLSKEHFKEEDIMKPRYLL